MTCIKKMMKQMSMRWKITIIFLTMLTLILVTVSGLFMHYSRKNYTKLQEKYNEAAMREMFYQLDSIWNNVDMMYRTFNSQKLFSQDAVTGENTFDTVTRQMKFEHMVTDVIHGNNLQNIIGGTLFYLDEDSNYYVGEGATNGNLKINETEWYQAFAQSGGKLTIYGPLVEDIKSPATNRNESLYFIAPYGTICQGADTIPFMLFSIRLDSLLSAIDGISVKDRAMVVVNSNGELLHASDVPKEKTETILEPLLKNVSDHRKTFSYFDDDCYVCAYYHPGFEWWVVFLDDAQTFFEDLIAMLQKLVVLISVIAIASVVLIYLLINKVMMPLTTLNEFIDIMQHDPNAYISVEPGTEAGRIGARLNEMKEKIGTMTQEMYQLQLQERDAQISALQSQINPHFIYNTLDNIYCIAQMGETEPIISLSEHLSKMMRYSLSMKRSVVPMEDELSHLESYVTILNVRFGDKIRVINEIPESLLQCPVLKLSLQPLAENAWYHSLISCPEGGEIILRARVAGKKLELIVENTGAPVSQKACDEINQRLKTIRYSEANLKASHGIALENISNRLKLTFGECYKLDLSPRPEGGCRVTMTVPYQMNMRTE